MTEDEAERLVHRFFETRESVFELCISICRDLADMKLSASHCEIAIRAAQEHARKRIAANQSSSATVQ